MPAPAAELVKNNVIPCLSTPCHVVPTCPLSTRSPYFVPFSLKLTSVPYVDRLCELFEVPVVLMGAHPVAGAEYCVLRARFGIGLFLGPCIGSGL